ncbi:hypothetical protein [Formosa sp. S-31]|uniref:hypothetical protein n=1 Tax=Formosa sp. S-31 TaxID=2790949 RepID=UPI003EB8B4F1
MKPQLEKLIKVREELIRKTEKRDAAALKRTDAWYQSEKGKAFEAKTAQIANTAETLNEAIKELETCI